MYSLRFDQNCDRPISLKQQFSFQCTDRDSFFLALSWVICYTTALHRRCSVNGALGRHILAFTACMVFPFRMGVTDGAAVGVRVVSVVGSMCPKLLT